MLHDPHDRYERLARRLKLRGLRVVLAVYDHGSFRRAGQHLHVTQPAVTAAVADVEAALGVRLFDRTPQGVIPTLNGERFIRRAMAVMGELQRASDDIDRLASGAAGRLVVGTNPNPAAGILVPAMTRMLDRFPDAAWSVHEGLDAPMTASLKARAIDVSIAHVPEGGLTDPELASELLYEDSLCVWANRSHPLVGCARLTWNEVAGEGWLQPATDDPLHAFIERVLHQGGLRMPQNVLQTASVAMRDGMLARADSPFVAFGLRVHHAYTPLNPLLAILNVDLPPISYAYSMITLKGREPNPLGVCLRDEIRSLAAQGVQSGAPQTRRPAARNRAKRVR